MTRRRKSQVFDHLKVCFRELVMNDQLAMELTGENYPPMLREVGGRLINPEEVAKTAQKTLRAYGLSQSWVVTFRAGRVFLLWLRETEDEARRYLVGMDVADLEHDVGKACLDSFADSGTFVFDASLDIQRRIRQLESQLGAVMGLLEQRLPPAPANEGCDSRD